MGSGTLACDSYSPKLDPTTGARNVETHTAWSKCQAKWKITESLASSNVSHGSRPRMRLLPELGFSASSALTCSLSHSGYRSQGYLRMLLLLCCLDTLPKKYRFPSQPVGGDDNNNNGATHGGQRMSSGSGGGGGGDLIPVWCGSTSRMVCGVWRCGTSSVVWYEEQEVGGRLSSTCAPPPREHRPAFQSSVGQQLVSRSEQGL